MVKAVLSFDILGSRVTVSTDDAELARQFGARFGAFRTERKVALSQCISMILLRGERGWLVDVAGRRAEVPFSREGPLPDDLIRFSITALRQDLRFVHASSVAHDGRAALLVGASTCGKSTMALALCGAGVDLFSDDMTPLDLSAGSAFPFPTRAPLRPCTNEVAGSLLRGANANPKPLAEAQAAVKVANVFFLHPRGGRPVVTDRKAEWDKVYWLSTGLRPRSRRVGPLEMTLHTPDDFDCEPELEPCRASVALKELCKHLYPPHPPIKELLPQMASFLDHVKCFTLVPGHLDRTVQLVLEAMSWQGTK